VQRDAETLLSSFSWVEGRPGR